jgi:hypothetical protein
MSAFTAMAVAAVAAAVIGGGSAVYSADQNRKATNEASDKAKENALRQEKMSEEASNRANQKTPDANAIMSAAQQMGKAGASGTMLTGPSGIDQNALGLGKKSLLGS